MLYGASRLDGIVVCLGINIKGRHTEDIEIEGPRFFEITEARAAWRRAMHEGWTQHTNKGYIDGVVLQKIREWRKHISKVKSGEVEFMTLPAIWSTPYDKTTKGRELGACGTNWMHQSLNQKYKVSEDEYCASEESHQVEFIEEGDFDNYWNREGLFESESDMGY